jgi:hypothetical protein
MEAQYYPAHKPWNASFSESQYNNYLPSQDPPEKIAMCLDCPRAKYGLDCIDCIGENTEPMKRYGRTQIDKERFCSLYNDGMNDTEIGKALGIGTVLAYRSRTRNGLKSLAIKGTNQTRKPDRPIVPEELI